MTNCSCLLQVVAEAMNCTANIAKGLRKDYKGAAMTLCSGELGLKGALTVLERVLWILHACKCVLRSPSSATSDAATAKVQSWSYFMCSVHRFIVVSADPVSCCIQASVVWIVACCCRHCYIS